MAPRLWTFILGTMAFWESQNIVHRSPLPSLVVSAVKAQIPIQPRVPSDHKTSQLMPCRKTGTEITGHACDCHCAHRAARSCEQHRCHTNKAMLSPKVQKTLTVQYHIESQYYIKVIHINPEAHLSACALTRAGGSERCLMLSGSPDSARAFRSQQ